MDKMLLTPTEAADALGIGRSKVYKLVRAGTLASVRIDSCRRIPLEDLTAMIARLRGSGDAVDRGDWAGARGSVLSVSPPSFGRSRWPLSVGNRWR